MAAAAVVVLPRFCRVVCLAFALLCGVVGVSSCTDGPAATTPDSAVEGLTDAAVDVAADDVADAPQFDFGGGDDVLLCPGNAGCACASNVDCSSGLCVETESGGRCATLCTVSCPDGFLCRSTATAGDPISYCAPRGVRQCAPCTTHADCNAPLSVPAECVAAGHAGSFCASTCQTSADCLGDTTCEANPAGGSAVCLPTGGAAACTCSAWATAHGASTACGVLEGTQLCSGTRSCGAAGLGACSKTPGAVCVDAGCQNAAEGSPCDDGDPCTQSECQGQQCVATKNSCECKKHSDCAGKEDANLCNGTLVCNTASVPYKCEVDPATVVTCPPSSAACMQTSCEPASGQCIESASPDGSSCDDGEACTVETKCAAGICIGGISTCECQTSADCAAKDDADLCNGSLYCEPASHTCKVNPATVVACPASSNGCATNACQPATGSCVTQNKPDNTACSDGDACTEGDHCLAGTCSKGTTVCCKSDADCAGEEDGNLCNGKLFCNKASGKCQVNPTTVVNCPTGLDTTCQHNICEPTTGACALAEAPTSTLCDDGNPCSGGDHCEAGGCVSNTALCPCQEDADCASKEDANLCNGTLYCELTTHTCEVNPATVVTCPFTGDNPCAPIECQPATGECAPSPVLAGACDDGDPCTAPGSCEAGACVAGPQICQCQTGADCAVFDDGNPCNGSLFCDTSIGQCKPNPASVPVCPPSLDACSQNACDPATGACKLTAAKDGSQCSDGEACTKSDACEGGACKAGVLVCECLTNADCASNEDGNLCNGTLFCNKDGTQPACALNPASVVSCDTSLDGTCLQTACDPQSGACVGVEQSGACDDGDACTLSDACGGGVCLPGMATACDDGNPCTDDSCDGVGGCVFTNNTAACADGDACTQTDTCQGGSCVGANPVSCSAQDQCHDAGVCNSSSGVCSNPSKANGAGCNDGNACTEGDTCQLGACQSGGPLDCDDSDPCTDDSCSTGTGCVHTYNTAPCTDGDACTQTDTCQSGSCVGANPVSCSAQDQCHEAGVCDAGTGVCSQPAKVDGSGCSDGDACTQADACEAGSCVAGSPVVCTALDQCHEVGVCDAQTGVCSNPAKNNGVACEDGNPCTINDACVAGTCWSATSKPCSALDQCHDVGTCDTETGLCSNPNKVDGTGCSDGDACTQTDTCQGGSCVGANPVSCSAQDQCHDIGVCNPANGACSNPQRPNGSECDDGDACTFGEGCVLGSCLNSGQVSCDDGNPCTDDSCSAGTGCVHTYNTAPCTDGDACTQTDTCQSGSCVGANPVSCSAQDQCHEAGVCDAGTGVCSQPAKVDGSGCSDGDACTQADACEAGSCVAGSPVVCTALDQCHEVGVCDAQTGVCSNPAKNNGVACEDGNPCTINDACVAGTCWSATSKPCSALDQCHDVGTCDTETGLCSNPNKVDGTGCSDGDACTQTDTCQGGSCVGANPVSCAAQDQCHDAGVCNSSSGVCSNPSKANGAGCTDGDACTQTDTCQGGSCVGANPVSCAAQDQCHDAGVCNSSSGVCSNPSKANGAGCSDGNACTEGDTCELGACQSGGPLDCDDSNPCTDDSCDSGVGCVHATAACDDANPCTDDSCDSGIGCVFTPNVVACDDANPCTEQDACSAGTCTGIACGDVDEYTNPVCNPAIGCTGFEICNGEDDDQDGEIDDVLCGGEPCTCQPNGTAVCAASCTVCPNYSDVAIAIDDGGTQKVICAHDFHTWGMVADAPDTLSALNSAVVADSLTGLQWQRAPGSGTYTWEGAKSQCDGLVLNGQSDWRAPTVAELESIVDYAKTSFPAIDLGLFADTGGVYWTWMPHSGSSSAWYVNSNDGSVGSSSSVSYLSRCVR